LAFQLLFPATIRKSETLTPIKTIEKPTLAVGFLGYLCFSFT